jgi:hypothetical protein
MNPRRWEAVQDLFTRACALPAGEREGFVLSEASGDAELANEVLRMLRADSPPAFLEPPESLAAPTRAPSRLGDFELLREIGRGGMGIVYRARQLSLNREVALKVLPPTLTLTPRQIERFQREARAAARIHHPSVVSILTVGQQDEWRYIAMELVNGPTLAEELRRLREELDVDDATPHLPSSHAETYFRRVAEIARQAADGLQHAHEQRVVHRDVKPSNLLLDEQGSIRIVDFGLARDEAQGRITETGDLAGTPHYMSPEQARARGQRVDQRTDVYSLGVVLFELLTLRRPFEGRTSQEVLHNILEREAPRIRSLNARVPRDLEVICNTAMAKDLADRYLSAGELRDDLGRFLAHQAIRARPPSLWRVFRQVLWKRRRTVAAGLLGLAGIAAGIRWQDRVTAQRQMALSLERLEALEGHDDWSAVEPEVLAEGRRTLDELALRGAIEAGRSRELRERFEALRQAWRDDARAAIEAGRRAESPAALDGVDDERALEGLLQLTRALAVFPGDPELAGLVKLDLFHPRLSVVAVDEGGLPLGGRVTCRPLDSITGQPGIEFGLGSLPLENCTVPPGYYRLIVRAEGHAPRELTRLLARGRDPEPIRCTLRGDGARLEGMQALPGGTLTFPAHGERNCPLLGRETQVEPFFLDEAPVTIGQFRAFLRESSYPPPQDWQYLPSEDASFDDLPAAAIDWVAALAFAEFHGKRLPAHAEWAFAVRGARGEPFELRRGGGGLLSPPEVLAPSLLGTPEQAFRLFLAEVPAVHAEAGVRGRNGLWLPPGGMYEWTESLGYELSSAGFVPRGGMRLLISPTRYTNYSESPHALMAPPDSNARTGFRCALSATP